MSAHLRDSCQHNQEMVALVAPPDWGELAQTEPYDLVAVGGGTAGMVASAGAAALGARSAMIEKELMGGDCLVTGCVPSKALIRAAHAAHAARTADRFGLRTSVEVDFAAVMDRLRKTRARVSHHDSAGSFTDRGVHVLFGEARFTGPDTLSLDGRTVRFKRAVIATGARPFLPPIPGIEDVGVLTSSSVFELEENPGHLAVLGGGAIGCEIAQAMRRLGVEVTVIEMAHSLLPREDPDAGAIVADALMDEGVKLLLGSRCIGMSRTGDKRTLELDTGETVVCDELLVAVGRAPNVEGLGLEAAGVAYDRRGVEVDHRHRTTNRRIYAAGDVCSKQQFTHAAYAQAEYAVFNALFGLRFNARDRVMPRATFTDPEVAHVGAGYDELQAMGDRVRTIEVSASEVDRLVIDGHPAGFARIHLARGSDRILAATVVCEGAGELIAELALAMTKGLGLAAIADVVHAYPTRSELIRKAADQYNFERVTPTVQRALGWWFRLLR